MPAGDAISRNVPKGDKPHRSIDGLFDYLISGDYFG
jgi:hypothetical protein